MMRILITNDDGIMANGIIRLAEIAQHFGEVWVIAPESQRSAVSHSITLRTYIDCHKVDFPVAGVHAYAISGTPGDCVRVGVLNIMPQKPDVVLSGINFGYNSATDIQYSATVGAALEAKFQGIHAIAISEGTESDTQIAMQYLPDILKELIDKKLGFGEIWNVNFPNGKAEDLEGILKDRTISHYSLFDDHYSETELPDGGIRFMVDGRIQDYAEEGSDLKALFDGYISIGVVRNLE